MAPKSQGRQFTMTRKDEHGEHVIEVQGGAHGTQRGRENRTSSQERIIEEGSSVGTSADIGLEMMDPHRVGISKTVEFKVYGGDN